MDASPLQPEVGRPRRRLGVCVEKAPIGKRECCVGGEIRVAASPPPSRGPSAKGHYQGPEGLPRGVRGQPQGFWGYLRGVRGGLAPGCPRLHRVCPGLAPGCPWLVPGVPGLLPGCPGLPPGSPASRDGGGGGWVLGLAAAGSPGHHPQPATCLQAATMPQPENSVLRTLLRFRGSLMPPCMRADWPADESPELEPPASLGSLACRIACWPDKSNAREAVGEDGA